ncbi:restriction endonuclease [Dermacoccus nishinomiyaensis]|uniref:restriction endonuclease n=1 Tax=Dermacoccus nishinomiyaensis TaxID=1274 RepID=UPI0021A2C3DB|nr:restriction endonuclease [Dermacoccus nishinomiyaensis]MCT1605230.1 restriction endonuclease [Dermacoccus nishinomiyaensis]
MTIPDFQSLMRPVLAALADGEVRRSRHVKDAMVEQFELSAEERAQMLPSGRQRTMDNRVGWATTYLSQAGLIERPQRGQLRISPAGREALRRFPERIDMKVLETYPEYLAFRDRTRISTSDEPSAITPTTSVPETPELDRATPSELIERARRTNRAAVEGEVLKKALTLSPTGFEDLVIRLLEAMGYGRAGSVERTSATGDAGVDGIISQDPLGLDRIYVQAKRYAEDRPIDRPRIHEFAGALLGKQGDRGVFITTSRFTQGAHNEADRINARIELIDGAKLAQLLVVYGVGVQTEETVVLYGLDEDFFESL